MNSFKNWLDEVMDGLPAELVEEIQTEYTAHYEDAVEDHQSEGFSGAESEQIALGQLGTAKKVSRKLKDVHIGRATYLSGLYASALLLFLFIASQILYVSLDLKDGSLASRGFMSSIEFILVTFSLYILFAMRRLLEWHYEEESLVPLITFIGVGMVWQSGAVIISRLLYDYSGHDEALRTLSSYTSATDLILLVSILIGRFIMGCGLVMLGWRLSKVSDSLYGLRKPIAGGIMLMGFCAATYGISVNIDLYAPAELAYVGMMLGHAIIWPLTILLFFRVLYRNPIHTPLKTT